eukprot:scaffold834_cov311-Prasinococcus_capsulatus_cf.AAC.13
MARPPRAGRSASRPESVVVAPRPPPRAPARARAYIHVFGPTPPLPHSARAPGMDWACRATR